MLTSSTNTSRPNSGFSNQRKLSKKYLNSELKLKTSQQNESRHKKPTLFLKNTQRVKSSTSVASHTGIQFNCNEDSFIQVKNQNKQDPFSKFKLVITDIDNCFGRPRTPLHKYSLRIKNDMHIQRGETDKLVYQETNHNGNMSRSPSPTGEQRDLKHSSSLKRSLHSFYGESYLNNNGEAKVDKSGSLANQNLNNQLASFRDSQIEDSSLPTDRKIVLTRTNEDALDLQTDINNKLDNLDIKIQDISNPDIKIQTKFSSKINPTLDATFEEMDFNKEGKQSRQSLIIKSNNESSFQEGRNESKLSQRDDSKLDRTDCQSETLSHIRSLGASPSVQDRPNSSSPIVLSKHGQIQQTDSPSHSRTISSLTHREQAEVKQAFMFSPSKSKHVYRVPSAKSTVSTKKNDSSSLTYNPAEYIQSRVNKRVKSQLRMTNFDLKMDNKEELFLNHSDTLSTRKVVQNSKDKRSINKISSVKLINNNQFKDFSNAKHHEKILKKENGLKKIIRESYDESKIDLAQYHNISPKNSLKIKLNGDLHNSKNVNNPAKDLIRNITKLKSLSNHNLLLFGSKKI